MLAIFDIIHVQSHDIITTLDHFGLFCGLAQSRFIPQFAEDQKLVRIPTRDLHGIGGVTIIKEHAKSYTVVWFLCDKLNNCIKYLYILFNDPDSKAARHFWVIKS